MSDDNTRRLTQAEQREAARLMIEEVERQRDDAKRDAIECGERYKRLRQTSASVITGIERERDTLREAIDQLLLACPCTVQPGELVRVPAEALSALKQARHPYVKIETVEPYSGEGGIVSTCCACGVRFVSLELGVATLACVACGRKVRVSR